MEGEVVKILDGPFLNLTGEIEDIDAERGTLKVSVSIFGRFTPVDGILASRESGRRISYFTMAKKTVGQIKLQLPAVP